MAKYYAPFSSFAEVAEHYNSTRPVNEATQGIERDLRPLADRKRKWEHVHKFSDNCYGLFDGDRGDPSCRFHRFNVTKAESKKLCPILWTRRRDGTETITIRNGSGNFAHVGRYSFLDRFLPCSMGLQVKSGKQYIQYDRKSYYLAKSKLMPKAEFSHYNSLDKSERVYGRIHAHRYSPKDDGVALTFRRDSDGGFTYLDGGKPIPRPPLVRINKKLKAKYKPHIEELWQFICTVGVMLPVNDYQYMRDTHQELRDADRSCSIYGQYGSIPVNLALDIVKDYNHPLRLNIAAHYVSISDIKLCQTDDDVKRVRAHFNRWINKTCGFNITK